MKRKITAILLSLATALPLFACSEKTPTLTAEQTADVWTATGTERILGDLDYSARYGSKNLTISAFKNEYESAQIIISAKANVKEYKVQTADLKDGNGNVLSKDAFEVYHEKYMYVGVIKNHNSPTGTGYYPDALLPFDVAEAYDENKIDKSFNQGVWLTLNVPEAQAAGTYSGQFKVLLDGKEITVPVSVNVYDYTLDDEVHSKSAFYIHPQRLAWGEMDDSVEMQETYYEYLLSYRVDPTHLPGSDFTYVKFDEAGLERFLAYAKKYTLDERCSHFNIPYNVTSTTYQGKEIQCTDWEEFGKTLRAMAFYSAEHGVDLFKKAGTYFTYFDEYDLTGKTDAANYNLNKAYQFCEELAEELKDELTCDEALKTEILTSLAGIKHKVVGSYTENLTADKGQFVPTIDKFHTEEGRKLYSDFDYMSYGDDGEMWTYTCMNPRPPYPTYHLDDTLLSSRLLGWMMYDYDIVGNLYWETVLYSYMKDTTSGVEDQLQNYYDMALRYPTANGDGYLLYPGRPYGIDGPVGSVRLQSIRDGNEDYDLFYALEALYAARGTTEKEFDDLTDLLSRNIYSGTAVRMSDGLYGYFSDSRDMLAGLLESAANAGTVIESFENVDGKAKFVVSAPTDTTLKLGGQTLTGVAEGSFIKYNVEIPLDKAVNTLELVSEKGGKSYTISLDLGGVSRSVSAVTLKDATNISTGGTASVETIDGTDALKIEFNAGKRLLADIDVSSLNVTADILKVTFSVYVYGESEVKLVLRSKCVDGAVYDEVTTVTLKPGWNEISVSTLSFGCQTYGALQYLRLMPETTESVAIALGQITLEG